MKFNFLYFLIILSSFILALFLYSALNENLFFSPYYGIGSGSGSGQVCTIYIVDSIYVPEGLIIDKNKRIEIKLNQDATKIDDPKNLEIIKSAVDDLLRNKGVADFVSTKFSCKKPCKPFYFVDLTTSFSNTLDNSNLCKALDKDGKEILDKDGNKIFDGQNEGSGEFLFEADILGVLLNGGTLSKDEILKLGPQLSEQTAKEVEKLKNKAICKGENCIPGIDIIPDFSKARPELILIIPTGKLIVPYKYKSYCMNNNLGKSLNLYVSYEGYKICAPPETK